MKYIMINPGHGGSDPGARDNGYKYPIIEKKANLNVATKLCELLEKAGYFVIPSRMYDTDAPLSEVQAAIRRLKPDLVVSVHHNAGGGRGAEILAQIKDSERGPSKQLALLILEEYSKLGQTSRGIVFRPNAKKTADYYGLLRTAAEYNIPAVISEYAFLDSDDVKDIDTLTEQHAEAQAVFNAIQQFYA